MRATWLVCLLAVATLQQGSAGLAPAEDRSSKVSGNRRPGRSRRPVRGLEGQAERAHCPGDGSTQRQRGLAAHRAVARAAARRLPPAAPRRTRPSRLKPHPASPTPQLNAAEAAKAYAAEWSMEAAAHVASLVVRDQHCKVGGRGGCCPPLI